MASGIKTEVEGDETLNPRAPVLITFNHIKKEVKVETETNNEPITLYSVGEMCKPQDTLNSDFTGNMTETMTHTTEKMKIDKHCKKLFTCSVCSKSYSCKYYLKYHLRIHSGEKLSKCYLCGKGFILKSFLAQHLKKHTGDKPNRCYVCGKGFRSNSYFYEHLKIHSENPYKCDLCGKVLSTKLQLSLHLKIHTGDKSNKCNNQYNCKTCGRSQSCEDCLYFK